MPKCECCGVVYKAGEGILVRHHWFSGKYKVRHERMVCEDCNSLLVRGDIEFDIYMCRIKHPDWPDMPPPIVLPMLPHGVRKQSTEGSHFLPSWEDQVKYVSWCSERDEKMGRF